MQNLEQLRIPLAVNKCNNLSLFVPLPKDEELLKILPEIDKKKKLSYYEEYYSQEVLHSISIEIIRFKGEFYPAYLMMNYGADSPGSNTVVDEIKTRIKPTQIYEKLVTLSTSFRFRCYCTFNYLKDEKRLTLPLPIKLEKGSFDEIRGIRIVKLSNNNIILDRTEDMADGRIKHTIRFDQESKFLLGLPNMLLEQAVKISLEL
jgi:hypothetical protein